MIRIYTDASARFGFKPGFAAVITRKDRLIEIVAGLSSRDPTPSGQVQQDISLAEVFGVLAAISKAGDEGAEILTDSKLAETCVDGIKRGFSHDIILQHLQNVFYTTSSGALQQVLAMLSRARLDNIVVRWIPRGSDKWIVLADEAANQARLMGEDPKVSDEDKYYWLDLISEQIQAEAV